MQEINATPVALVTGSARGIGRAIAIQLAKEGYDIVINGASPVDPSNTDSGAYEVARRVHEAGRRAIVVRADIASRADRDKLIGEVEESFGRLDLLVNNAGIAPRERNDMLEATEESFEHLMRVNLQGPYFLTQRAARWMITLQAGGIVKTPRIAFVGSISSYASSINRGDYCISKAGISMACQLFAHRLGEHHIPVVEFRPGITATDMTAGVKEKYDALIAGGLLATPRWGQPEDVARAVAAFGRGDLDYSTGVAIDVSGGFQMIRL
jgi:NAD(P)-dependent dehydrogenase (short-subunit alcohol dehydrogenase family)